MYKGKTDARLLARILARDGVRNTILEDYHMGITPYTEDGRAVVVTTKGVIPWDDVSRISDKEMRVLMLEVETGIETVLRVLKNPPEEMEMWGKAAIRLTEEQRRVIYQCFFGKHGVSWDIPTREWNKLLKFVKENRAKNKKSKGKKATAGITRAWSKVQTFFALLRVAWGTDQYETDGGS